MAKGRSLHIGVNFVNREHYGVCHQLNWCGQDAVAMQELARGIDYDETYCLLNDEATSRNVFRVLDEMRSMEPGDIFLITFSGHGALCPDYDQDERSGYDEAWVLYDRMLVDDEAMRWWARFDPKVRITIVTDCCYSGLFFDRNASPPRSASTGGTGERSFSPFLAAQVIERNWNVYRNCLSQDKNEPRSPVRSPLLQLAACGSGEAANEYRHYGHGAFTHTLLEVWRSDKFGDYEKFIALIAKNMPFSGQTPCLHILGPNCKKFNKERPFRV